MPRYKEPASLEELSCQVLLAILYHLTIKHDHDVTQSAARRQFLLATVLSKMKQELVTNITASLNLDLNLTCKLLDYTLDCTTTGENCRHYPSISRVSFECLSIFDTVSSR